MLRKNGETMREYMKDYCRSEPRRLTKISRNQTLGRVSLRTLIIGSQKQLLPWSKLRPIFVLPSRTSRMHINAPHWDRSNSRRRKRCVCDKTSTM
jgi:hypothetical protein